jgi:cell division protein FtsB
MTRFGRKANLTTLFFSKFTLVIVILVSLYLSVSVYKRYTVEREMSGRRSDAENEYRELEARRDTLLDKVEYLRADSGIESEIRKHFDVAREGEQVVIILDDAEGEGVAFTEGTAPSVASTKKWYQFWR